MFKNGCLQSALVLIAQLLISAVAFVLVLFLFPLIFHLPNTSLAGVLPYVAAIIIAACVFLILHAFLSHGDDVVRGETLIPAWYVALKALWKVRGDNYSFYWGGLHLPFNLGVRGLAAIGAPGSGKTVSIRLFLQSVVPHIGIAPDHRALIYDAKGNMYQMLSGMGVDVSLERELVKNLNPYDVRSYSWEICFDIQDMKTLDEISLIFIPIETKGDEYWANQARLLLQEILKSFVLSGSYWTLRDLCAVIRTTARMKFVLNQHPQTKASVQSYLELGKTTDGIVSTLQSRMKRYEVIAALWEHAEGKISLTEWLHNEDGSITLLGRGERGSALDAINQLIVSRLGQLISDSSYPNSEVRRTWIVFDEIRQCGRLDLDSIATMGREKGASLVIGFQDKSGLNDAYNENIANELLGMCQHKAIFALSSDTTAQWASHEFGTQEIIENEQRRERATVLSSEFTSTRHIPVISWWKGLTGFYKIYGIGAYKKTIRGWRLFGVSTLGMKGLLCDLDTNIQGYIGRDKDQQIMADWTTFDLDRLGYQWTRTDLGELKIVQEEDEVSTLNFTAQEWIDPLANFTKVIVDKQEDLSDDDFMEKKFQPNNIHQALPVNSQTQDMAAYKAERERLFQIAMEDAFRQNDEALRKLAE